MERVVDKDMNDLYLKPSSAVVVVNGGNLSHSNAVVAMMMMLTAEYELYISDSTRFTWIKVKFVFFCLFLTCSVPEPGVHQCPTNLKIDWLVID